VPETIRVPGVKSWVKGLANIRGALMPILDLKAYLQNGETQISKKNRILIINKSGVLAGLLVEEVFGLRKFKEGMLEENKSDGIAKMNISHYVVGEFSDNNEHWNVFSIKTLLTTERFLRVV
jgi:twitching motility protein PilI